MMTINSSPVIEQISICTQETT